VSSGKIGEASGRYICETPKCRKVGRYAMPGGERLCAEHGRSDHLGTCGSCSLGIVVDVSGEIQACGECARNGSGFGDADAANDSAARIHVARILNAVADLGAVVAKQDADDVPGRENDFEIAYGILRSVTRTLSVKS
jgi:hypothetical protein